MRFLRSASRISTRLTISIFLFGLVSTLGFSIVKGYNEYHKGLAEQKSQMDMLQQSHMQSLSNNMWVAAHQEVKDQLEGMVLMPAISFAQVVEGTRIIAKAGKQVEDATIERSYPILHLYNGVEQPLGFLFLEADLSVVRQELRSNIKSMLINQLIEFVLLAGLFLFLFQMMVTRHLEHVARFLRTADPRKGPATVQLQRSPPASSERMDELDEMVAAVNEQARLLSGFYNEMEFKVEERTEELLETNRKLRSEVEERMRAEHALLENRTLLQKSEKRFRSLVSNIPGAVYRYSADDTKGMLFISEEIENISGYKRFDFMGSDPVSLNDLLHPEDRERIMTLHTREADLMIPREIEYRIFNKSGDIRWVQEFFVGVAGEDNSLEFVDGVIFDVTETVTARESIKESDKRFRLLVEASPFAMLLNDSEENTVYINPAFSKITGYELSDIPDVQSWLAKAYPSEEARALVRERRKALINPQQFGRQPFSPLSRDVHCKDGTIKKMEVRAALVGELDLTIYIDVTERHRLEELREDIERITRHDLRSPAVSTLSLIRILKEEATFSPEQLSMIDHLEFSAKRMLDTINVSMDLYRMEMGQFSFLPEPINIRELIDECSAGLLADPSFEEQEIQIHHPDDASCIAAAERTLLGSALINLIKNALEATIDGSPVEVRIHPGQMCTVTIHNSGTVPAGIRASFFEKYVTAGKTRGTGLGTYSARLIVSALGGSISMETSEQDGTTLTIHIPRKK